MCESCGCGESDAPLHTPHHHTHEEDHKHADHEHLPDGRIVTIRKGILGENNRMAERNRGFLEAKQSLCFNVVGSPGSGKTTLLERTCMELGSSRRFYVIEGDQQSSLDAERILKTGTRAIQINTEYGCHLDAHMVSRGLKELSVEANSHIFIENIGNLVCPALFDLGENRRIVVYSVTEGNDKPLKYPYMFRSAHLVVISKTDLIPYVDFDPEKARDDIRKTNPELKILELSVKTGEGIQAWYDWLTN